jgi:hypothetical protein
VLADRAWCEPQATGQCGGGAWSGQDGEDGCPGRADEGGECPRWCIRTNTSWTTSSPVPLSPRMNAASRTSSAWCSWNTSPRSPARRMVGFMYTTRTVPLLGCPPGEIAAALVTSASGVLGRLVAALVVGGVEGGAGAVEGAGHEVTGQGGSAGGVAFPDLGDKGLDGGEGEVRAVAEDGVTRSDGRRPPAAGRGWPIWPGPRR